MKLICVFNFKEEKKVSLWLGNSRRGSSLPFFPSQPLSCPGHTRGGPVLGGQGNRANLLFSFTPGGTTEETFIFPDVDYS